MSSESAATASSSEFGESPFGPPSGDQLNSAGGEISVTSRRDEENAVSIIDSRRRRRRRRRRHRRRRRRVSSRNHPGSRAVRRNRAKFGERTMQVSRETRLRDGADDRLDRYSGDGTSSRAISDGSSRLRGGGGGGGGGDVFILARDSGLG